MDYTLHKGELCNRWIITSNSEKIIIVLIGICVMRFRKQYTKNIIGGVLFKNKLGFSEPEKHENLWTFRFIMENVIVY